MQPSIHSSFNIELDTKCCIILQSGLVTMTLTGEESVQSPTNTDSRKVSLIGVTYINIDIHQIKQF